MDTRQATQMLQASQTPIHKYRRNRKIPSCEPCRKSKVACNHNLPCSRCIKRRRIDECYYHPNPLTRNPQEAIVTPAAKDVPISPEPRITARGSSYEQPDIGDDSEAVNTVQEYNHRSNFVLQRAGSAPPFANHHETSTGRHGFLGFTSHVSIMTEDLMQLGLCSGGLDKGTAVQSKPIMNERLASGCRALSVLQNRAMIDRGIDLFFESIECIHTHCGEFIVRQWLSELWSAHGDTLSSQNAEQIRQLCELLCQNTAKPLIFDGSTTARQWVRSATGENIRWATLAMIANYVATYAMVAKSDDPFFKDYSVDRQSLIDQMLEASEVCIGFCREYDALDDAFLCALLELYNLTEFTKGEASYAAYRIGAEVSSALVAMGLHQEINANKKVPFFLAELRKRVRTMVYGTEISIATFLGRPPRLSHRFMNLDPPLDLTESELFSEDPQKLAFAITRLDDHGYNRDGDIRLISWVRSSIGFVVRREDILELSIGNYTPDEVRQKAVDIQRKTEEHWLTLPHYLSSLKESLFGLDTPKIFHLHLRNVFRQIGQSNLLLLHRLLVRKAGADPGDLIRTAQAILSDVMRSYKRIEMSAATSFIYFLAVHGIRSAVILAVELLKQEQLPVYPEAPLLPRSRTIQDLSIFADKLSDLDPTFGDKSLFEKGQKVISLILDKILSPPRSSERHYDQSSTQTRRLHIDANTATNIFQHSTHSAQSTYAPESYMFMSGFGDDIDSPHSFLPGQTITGYVSRTSRWVNTETNVSIALHGKCNTKLFSRDSYQCRGSVELFGQNGVRQELFNGALHIITTPHPDENKWLFAIDIPIYPDAQSLRLHPLGKASYLPLLSTKQHALPPSFDLGSSGVSASRRGSAAVEYYLEATMKTANLSTPIVARLPIQLRCESSPFPITDFDIKLQSRQLYTITSSHLLPANMQTPKLSMGHKVGKVLRPSKAPRLTFCLETSVPSVLQIDSPYQIPFELRAIPQWMETSECIAKIRHTINIEKLKVGIRSTSSITGIASGALGPVPVVREDTSTTKILLADYTKPKNVNRVDNQEIPCKTSMLTDNGDSMTLPIDEDAGPLNFGEVLDLNMQRGQDGIYAPTFITYNIKRTYELEWKMTLEVGGERVKVKGRHPVLIMERTDQD
ncbi:uncharacterized protein BHQ10_003517 [Talaromyces amestolkiae]|uniref:Zn(2)-C6 fungal-type domain-containing protein n=1 Tax=Talaromyces amestolkiae TaxID=1196081 RepID=A0A364KVC2_TALAM|nr:uncharacterized protein BHQ10_003517 [Talaromyces amestolkiae]RAO67505.1 hypothetical protein BHQ10_003517 [Talaromyces amestolkiae]